MRLLLALTFIFLILLIIIFIIRISIFREIIKTVLLLTSSTRWFGWLLKLPNFNLELILINMTLNANMLALVISRKVYYRYKYRGVVFLVILLIIIV